MPRPHEDLQRHTLVDHRAGGAAIAFPDNAWFAIEIAHVKRKRNQAAVSAYETMIERARHDAPGEALAAVFSSASDREVFAVCEVTGHEGFRQIESAWDDHHRFVEGHAVAESRSLKLYNVAATFGTMAVDPRSHDAYVFERVHRERKSEHPVTANVVESEGFRGAVVFQSDGGGHFVVIYRFGSLEQFDASRTSSSGSGEHVRPVKTFSRS